MQRLVNLAPSGEFKHVSLSVQGAAASDFYMTVSLGDVVIGSFHGPEITTFLGFAAALTHWESDYAGLEGVDD